MRAKYTILFLCLWVAMLLMASCSEDIKPTPFTFTKVFTGSNSKTWRIDHIVLREKEKKDQAISLSSCELDDRYLFYANDEKLFEVSNGASKCDTDEEDMLVSYNWGYSSANANLTMVVPHVFGNYVIPFIVRKAATDEMQLEVFLNEEGTISYVLFFKVVDEN